MTERESKTYRQAYRFRQIQAGTKRQRDTPVEIQNRKRLRLTERQAQRLTMTASDRQKYIQ